MIIIETIKHVLVERLCEEEERDIIGKISHSFTS